MKGTASILIAVMLIGAPAYSQTVSKLRVLTAPGVTDTAQKDWSNTLTVSDKTLKLTPSVRRSSRYRLPPVTSHR